MNLRPGEDVLIGGWVIHDGCIKADETELRIQYLIAYHLHNVSTADGGWSTLFLDPDSGFYWELTYPQSHMHGGGPRNLRRMSLEEARIKYGIK